VTSVSPAREPIAIVGIGCRFPGGVRSAQDLYELLINKRSGIVEVLADRWDAAAFYHPDFRKPGRMHVTRGGFLENVDQFDPAFFGISPHEAHRMDPHQRLVLETTLEAIEDAGIRLDEIAGRNIAVVIGCTSPEFHAIQTAPAERDFINGSTNTGSMLSILANRVSYVFDLRGPSFTVDTACSSSLTALHNACREIWQGSAEAAFAGGANLILKPEISLSFSKGNYLSPDGECRSFSDDANGYVRSEGVGIVYLKRLSDALANGDRIYAIIRGSALNQDGRTPGMTLPSQAAQEQLLRSACEDAGVKPGQISYVEAHGTGTPAGDPIEANAIGAVIGQSRAADDVCLIGSIKTNIGHLECAAGIAGLVKLALTLKTRTIFPNLNYRGPNPVIPFEDLRLQVPTAPTVLKGTRLFGGINSFGFGGANAHLVLESPPEDAKNNAGTNKAGDDRDVSYFLAVSARSAPALKQAATQMAQFVACSSSTLPDICANAALRRTAYEFRLGVRGKTREEFVSALTRFAETGEPNEACSFGRVPEGQPRPVAFLFSGQGPQWWGMARQLLETKSTFRQIVTRIDRELRRVGWLGESNASLLNELTRSSSSTRMAETQVAQPAIFAVQMGIAALLKEHDVIPSAVLGHSIGELAAASCAGILSLEEATRIVYWRSRCQAAAEGKGVMAAVGLPEEEIQPLLAPYHGRVEIAAVNGPKGVTLAGLHNEMEALGAVLGSKHVFYRRLNVSVPFHCFLMSPIEPAFREGLRSISLSPEVRPFYSSVTGTRVSNATLDVDYWWHNIRQKVSFYPALRSLLADGFRHFIEIGPHPVVSRDVSESLAKAAMRGNVLSTLVRPTRDQSDVQNSEALADDRANLVRLWSHLFAAGVPFRPDPRPRADIPFVALRGYPFQRQRFWHETHATEEDRKKPSRQLHPHIGSLRKNIASLGVFSCDLSYDARIEPYLAEHIVQQAIVVPAAAQVETVLAAAQHAFSVSLDDLDRLSLENVTFRRAIILPATGEPPAVRLEVNEDGDFTIASRPTEEDAQWTINTQGKIRLDDSASPFLRFSVDVLKSELGESGIPAKVLYAAAAKAGLELGVSFQGIAALDSNDERAIASVSVPETVMEDRDRFVFHPTALDSAFQFACYGPSLHVSLRADRTDVSLFIPAKIGALRMYRPLREARFECSGRYERKSADEATLDVLAQDRHGKPLLAVSGLVAKRLLSPSSFESSDRADYYALAWEAIEATGNRRKTHPASGRWIVFCAAPSCALGSAVVRSLRAQSRRVVVCYPGAEFCRVSQDVVTIRPTELSDYERMLAVDVTAHESIEGIIHLWTVNGGPQAPCDQPAGDQPRQRGPTSVGNICRALASVDAGTAKISMWVVTTGAQWVRPEDQSQVDPAASAMVGFGRVLRSEWPHLAATFVDLSFKPSDAEIQGLLDEMECDPTCHEIALRQETRWHRVLKSGVGPPSAVPRTVDVQTTSASFSARVKTPGLLASIALREHSIAPPGPQQVTIDVRAAGLTFKDVILALGVLDAEAFTAGLTGAELGMDCAGVVTELGADVSDLRVGDEVFCVARGSLGNRVVADRCHVVRKPARLSFVEAAALPQAYLTATLALEHLARVKSGETVLIHAASGGVGLAAIQIAKKVGSRIIGTAGSETKREFVRSQGAAYAFNSRSPDFHRDVMAATEGRGVDVVLNSLAGRAMSSGLRCLAPFGRFIEIGKTDLFANRQLGLRVLSRNRSYTVLDVDEWLVSKKDQIASLLSQCVADVERSRFEALPVRTFGLEHTIEAVEFLSQARHLGKVVVEIPQEGTLQVEPSEQVRLDSQGLYLVSGGCSGWGLATAVWLVERGARKIALFGRSGAPDQAGAIQIEEMRQCDVADPIAVCRLVDGLRSVGRIAGIVHAAAVFDDAPITLLDDARYARVMAPKTRGAVNLHEATRRDFLDFFVMYSSISAVIGTPGQANYAAANSFLDGFAARLRAEGVPATSINWGALHDVGILARATPEQRRKILGRGVRPMEKARALSILERALLSERAQVIAADLDRERLQSSGIVGIEFAEAGRSTHEDNRDHSPRESVLAVAASERVARLASLIAGFVAKITGQAADGVDSQTSLTRLGIDSLNAVEIDVWLQRHFSVSVPTVQLLGGPTSLELAEVVLTKMENGNGAPPELNGHGGIRFLKKRDDPQLTLICFPYMGGSGDMYRSWLPLLPPLWDLHVFDWPELAGPDGHILRDSTETIEEWMLTSLAPCIQGEFAFYGHSMGGWVALIVAERLFKQSGRLPTLVGLGAIPTPEAASQFLNVDVKTPEEISDEQLLRVADVLQLPPTLLRSEATRTRLIERMRRDIWLGTRFSLTSRNAAHLIDAPLPLLLFGGSHDGVPTRDKELDQLLHGIRPIGVKQVEGGHLFIDEDKGREQVIEELHRVVSHGD
jgi:acyl transferase domain-containing protein/NADPH:quinone reductase-like Zn-dependent oxidoreductase/surfactin synthase thioesterase subunit/NAD(P)-dependent dehydrogenase (short-subunit alcohol dehydrogenase family)/acyl carrier protein